MKEIPVLFNGEMVRAILDGRKVQTRRPIKIQPPKEWSEHRETKNPKGDVIAHRFQKENDCFFGGYLKEKSPFGKAGDVLWVRETFGVCPDYSEYRYKADIGMDREAVGGKWTPSIHMPRKACRTELRVKRV